MVSLGLSVKKINEFNDMDEMRDLADIIKQDKYIDYKTDYFSDGNSNLWLWHSLPQLSQDMFETSSASSGVDKVPQE